MAVPILGGLTYVLRKERLAATGTSLFLLGASVNLAVLAANGYMPTPDQPSSLWYLGDLYTPWLFSVADITVFLGVMVIAAGLSKRR